MIPSSTHPSINELHVPRERASRDDVDSADRIALQGAFHALVEQPVEPPPADKPMALSTAGQIPTDSDLALDQLLADASLDSSLGDPLLAESTSLNSVSESWDSATTIEDSLTQEPLTTVSTETAIKNVQNSGDQPDEITSPKQSIPMNLVSSPSSDATFGDSLQSNGLTSFEHESDESQSFLDDASTSAEDYTHRESSSDSSTDDTLDLSGASAGEKLRPTTLPAPNENESNASFVTLTELNRASSDSPTSLSSPTSTDSARSAPNTAEAEFAKSNVTGYSVELESESAGKVMIRVQDSADGIRARLVAASDTGYRLLESEMQNVRQVVEQSGIGLADFSLGRHDGQAAQSDHESRQPAGLNADSRNAAVEDPAPRTMAATTASSSTGLDVWA